MFYSDHSVPFSTFLFSIEIILGAILRGPKSLWAERIMVCRPIKKESNSRIGRRLSWASLDRWILSPPIPTVDWSLPTTTTHPTHSDQWSPCSLNWTFSYAWETWIFQCGDCCRPTNFILCIMCATRAPPWLWNNHMSPCNFSSVTEETTTFCTRRLWVEDENRWIGQSYRR